MPVVNDGEDFSLPEIPEAALPETEPEPTPEPEEELELPRFDEKVKEPFMGLLFLGALTEEFTFCGHKFRIRTLTQDEVLAIGQILKRFNDSVSQMSAYATAMVAACLISVDHQPLPTAIQSEATEVTLTSRMDYVSQWYPTTINHVYSQYLELEAKVDAVADAMGKVSG